MCREAVALHEMKLATFHQCILPNISPIRVCATRAPAAWRVRRPTRIEVPHATAQQLLHIGLSHTPPLEVTEGITKGMYINGSGCDYDILTTTSQLWPPYDAAGDTPYNVDEETACKDSERGPAAKARHAESAETAEAREFGST